MKAIFDRFFSWMKYEPVIGLLMITAAVIIFINVYKNDKDVINTHFWIWAKKVIEASAVALLFLGLLWGFRSILNNTYKTYRQSHGRVSQVNYESVKKIWGSPHVQREIQVSHYRETTVKEEIPREDPSKPPLYKTVTKTVIVEQNSILGSKGQAKLKLSKRKKGSAYYNGFTAEFKMEYKVVNDSGYETDARFSFPLSRGQLIYDPFEVLENGKNIGRDLRFSKSYVSWSRKMNPGEKITIKVRYNTRGLEYFYYQIPYAREINDFHFKLIVEGLSLSDINYPEGCLPPKKEGKRITKDGKGIILEWKFKKTLTTAGMGIALPEPEQPGSQVALVLRNSPLALMQLVVAICLTLLIQGKKINFVEISLLSAIYYLLFISLASVSDFFLGFWGTLVAGSILTMGLTYLLYRWHSGKTLSLVLGLVFFFTLVYPLSSLTPKYRDSLNGLVIIALIIYLFWITWYFRIQPKKLEQQ